jgi:hypothetical protein
VQHHDLIAYLVFHAAKILAQALPAMQGPFINR